MSTLDNGFILFKKKIVNKMDDENRSKQSDQRQSQSE